MKIFILAMWSVYFLSLPRIQGLKKGSMYIIPYEMRFKYNLDAGLVIDQGIELEYFFRENLGLGFF